MSRTNSPAPSEVAPSADSRKPPRLALLIATGLGVGFVPKAPGTAGSFLGVALLLLIASPYASLMQVDLSKLGFWRGMGLALESMELELYTLLLFLGVAFAGVWAAGRSARYWDQKDPQQVVIDEVSGVMFAIVFGTGIGTPFPRETAFSTSLMGIPVSLWWDLLNWKYLLAGFILFRIFDIWKPWPARAAEKLPGGWGIMADDWVAGIYAAICLWALRAVGL